MRLNMYNQASHVQVSAFGGLGGAGMGATVGNSTRKHWGLW
jgi:hypothetical protein